jgi:hypothetical protein
MARFMRVIHVFIFCPASKQKNTWMGSADAESDGVLTVQLFSSRGDSYCAADPGA